MAFTYYLDYPYRSNLPYVDTLELEYNVVHEQLQLLRKFTSFIMLNFIASQCITIE